MTRFFGSSDGMDKVLKTYLYVVDPAAQEIARMSHASEQTMAGLQTASNAVKVTRDVTGLLNVVRLGMIPKIYGGARQVGELAVGLTNSTDVMLKPGGTRHNDRASGSSEKALKLIATAARVGQGVTYVGGFGVAKPLANGEKYFGLEYKGAGKTLSKSFRHFMGATHALGTVHHIFDMAYQRLAYKNRSHQAYAYDNYRNDQRANYFGLAECSLELASDAIYFSGKSINPWLNIALQTAICGLGLYSVWEKTS